MQAGTCEPARHVNRIIACLHVSKKWFFFFTDSEEKKGFQPVQSLYFCVGQQKKNRLKRTSKKNRSLGACKPSICIVCKVFIKQSKEKMQPTNVKRQIFRSNLS